MSDQRRSVESIVIERSEREEDLGKGAAVGSPLQSRARWLDRWLVGWLAVNVQASIGEKLCESGDHVGA